MLGSLKKKKQIAVESIYNCKERKVKFFKLQADSNSMGFACYLKKEYLEMDFSETQRSDVLMNSVIVQLVQIMMILCIWKYAQTNDGFAIRPVKTLDMMIARFIASVMMHINVEKDVRAGISMMKYVVNHYENFTNPYPPFFLGMMGTIISLIVETNVMIILSSMTDVLSVINKYVSLAAIVNIPRFYYNSLVDHRITSCKDVKLEITKYRKDNPRKDAPCIFHLLRIIHKTIRLLFCTVSFYFMPFIAICLNFQFMVS